MPLHPASTPAAEPPSASSGWGPWSDQAGDSLDGQGPLDTGAEWIGGGLSMLLWSGVTLLALQWL